MNVDSSSHASDFTCANYKRLIGLAQEKYVFRGYNDYDLQEAFVIWRHDVDMSPQRALALASIEKEMGVCATYFFYAHSLFYNLYEERCTDIVRRIGEMGHEIGVHFDPSFYSIDDTDSLERWLAFERDQFQAVFDVPINAFSFHCTTPFTMSSDEPIYAGLVNATSEYFRTEVGYCSDSNGYWRFDRLEDVLAEGEHERLQVLTHPEHWQEKVMSPVKRYRRCVEGRAEATWNEFSSIVESFGRTLVDD